MTEAETTLASFRHYVDQIDTLLAKIAPLPDAAQLLASKVWDETFDSARQLGVALFFAARGVYRVAGLDMPAFPKSFDPEVLRGLAADVRRGLAGLSSADLRAAKVSHVAGFAELEQDPMDYMIRFALPNMMFHFAMGYAGLRAAGAPIGKADFDGLHAYPEGFSF